MGNSRTKAFLLPISAGQPKSAPMHTRTLIKLTHLRFFTALMAVSVLCLMASPGAHAATPLDTGSPVTAALIADQSNVQAGGTVRLALRLQHAPGWHTYWRNPGDSGLPTQFDLSGPDGAEVMPIQWPLPRRFLLPPLANFGYDGDVLLARSVRLPGQIESGTVHFEARASWLVCREVCLPGESTLTLEVPVSASGSAEGSPQAALFATAHKRLPAESVSLAAVLGENQLALHLPSKLVGRGLQRLEYFPFESGYISQAAPQTLFKVPATDGWRLEVPLAEGADRIDSLPGQQLSDASTGVLVVNDSFAFEVTALKDAIASNDPRFTVGDRFVSIQAHAVPMPGVTSAIAESDEMAAAGVGAAGSSVWIAMLFAALGGLILNLMPCVFPVIGLKILGFAGHGTSADGTLNQAQRHAIRRGCNWFAAGIVITFLILGGAMLAMQAAGKSVGWGFQLQSPAFVAAMALLFAAIGMNFSGLFEFGTSLTRLGNLERKLVDDQQADAEAKTSPWPALGSGVLAVLVATPCTAPFMGSALGFTMTQPTLITLLVFVSLGIGMALPYLVLGLKPGWLRLLPRPGRWMESLRQAMAFPMYGAAVWLAWVLGRQAGVDAMLGLLIGIVTLGLGLWIWGRFGQIAAAGVKRSAYGTAVVALVALALGVSWQSSDQIAQHQQASQVNDANSNAPSWQRWSRSGLEQLLAANKPVFVDFTASWCISCQVNKKTTLQNEAVTAAFQEQCITLMRADWTSHDAAITAELARHGRNGVPLYLMYKPGSDQPELLPALLTPSMVLDVVSKSGQPPAVKRTKDDYFAK